jgi:hypothetical protein
MTATPTATIANLHPPEVRISSPRDYSDYGVYDLVVFAARAQDVEDGDLSDAIIWTSDLGGVIGQGASFEINAHRLRPGVHSITAAVSDSDSQSGQRIVIITIKGNNAPAIKINQPSEGQIFTDDQVFLDGTADDLEDGDVTDSLVWTSSIDGEVAKGQQASVRLSRGVHTITARATDRLGAQSERTITITVDNW